MQSFSCSSGEMVRVQTITGRFQPFSRRRGQSGKRVTGITWQKVPREGSQATHPGVYCLRTNQLDWG